MTATPQFTLPTASTRVFALLGEPVSHSLSPALQNAAFRAAGVDGVYVALACSAEAFPGLARGLALAGGGGNVTIPHKRRAAELIERGTNAVGRTGACNTFWWEDGRVCGDNTDLAGFAAAARSLVGDPAGSRVLVLGAGGAARAAVAALLDAHAAGVVVSNRTPARAAGLRDALDPSGTRLGLALEPRELRGEAFDLVVNATALGLRPEDPLPLDLGVLRSAGAVLDLVYSPDETPWVRSARAAGIRAADGLEMLIRQAAAAFERWWGRDAPLEAMRTAVKR